MSLEECEKLKNEMANIIESEEFLEDLKKLPRDKQHVNVLLF